MEGKKVKHYIQQLLIINNSFQKHESTKHNMTTLPCSISNLIIEFPWEYWLLAAQDSISWRELFLLFWCWTLHLTHKWDSCNAIKCLLWVKQVLHQQLQCCQIPALSQTGVVSTLSDTPFEPNKCCNSSCKMLSNTSLKWNRYCCKAIKYLLRFKQVLLSLLSPDGFLQFVNNVLCLLLRIAQRFKPSALLDPLAAKGCNVTICKLLVIKIQQESSTQISIIRTNGFCTDDTRVNQDSSANYPKEYSKLLIFWFANIHL